MIDVARHVLHLSKGPLMSSHSRHRRRDLAGAEPPGRTRSSRAWLGDLALVRVPAGRLGLVRLVRARPALRLVVRPGPRLVDLRGGLGGGIVVLAAGDPVDAADGPRRLDRLADMALVLSLWWPAFLALARLAVRRSACR